MDYSKQIEELNDKIRAIEKKLEDYQNDYLVLNSLLNLVSYAQTQAENIKRCLEVFDYDISKLEYKARDNLGEIPGALDIVLFTGTGDNKKDFDACVGATNDYISNNSKIGLHDLGKKIEDCLEDLGHNVSSLNDDLNKLRWKRGCLLSPETETLDPLGTE